MNNKGQTVLSEHVMVFFVVVATLVAMTVFVQRSFESRMHEVGDYMIKTVNSACDANCQKASGGVSYGYEPYYMQALSDTYTNSDGGQGATKGNAAVIGAVYLDSVNEKTKTIAASCQLPSWCSGYAVGKCPYVCPKGS